MNARSDLRSFLKELNDHFDDLLDWSLQKRDRVRKGQHNPKDLAKDAKEAGASDDLVRAILNSDLDGIQDNRFELPKSKDWDIYKRAMEVQRRIWDFEEFLKDDQDDLEELYAEWRAKAISRAESETDRVVEIVDAACKRALNFRSSVVVSPYFNKSSEDYLPKSFGVKFGDQSNAPFFTLFVDGNKVEVDDIIEGGDTDFFEDVESQADYFNLIGELRSPGSTTRGKTIRLYTARPTKDRDFYMRSNEIPANVFLTSKLDEAEGLASDLGSNEVRDVWSVKVNTRFLVETLRSGTNVHYQTTQDTPHSGMDLLIPGTPNTLRARTIRLAYRSSGDLREKILSVLK